MEKVKVEFELSAPHAALLLKLTEITMSRSPSALARALLEAMFDADDSDESGQPPGGQLPN